MKSALLVGGTGFLGRALADALRAAGADVHVVDRSVHDVRTPLESPLPTVDAVFHLAQSPHYRDFPARARDVFATNLFSLNEYCAAAIDRARLFVFFSSGSVFGRPTRPVAPDAPPAPEGFYAFTKWAGEGCLRQYEPFYSTLVVRPFSPYGPGQRERILPLLAERIVAGEPVRLTRGLRMSFLHVRDLAELVAAAAARSLREPGHRAFNVSSSEIVSLDEVAGLLAKALDRPLSIEWDEGASDAVVSADCRDLYDFTGRTPQIPLEEGIAEFAAAFLRERSGGG